MDLNKVKVEAAQVCALLVQTDMAGIIITRLRKEIEDVEANIARDRENIRRHCVALSALGVNRVIYFVVRDLQRKVTKFVFLKDEDYLLLSEALKNINTCDVIERFESVDVTGPLWVTMFMEDIAAAASGPPVSVALDLLNKLVAEQEAYNASVPKRQKTKE